METPYLGQVIMTAFGFTPQGYVQCNGQLLPIRPHEDLFRLLGTRYGGDGKSTFGVPDLRGATPVGAGASADPAWTATPYALNERAGSETVVLQASQVAGHGHGKQAASNATATLRGPGGALLAKSTAGTSSEYAYADATAPTVELAANTVANAGGDVGHPNMQPFLVVSFCIATHGAFPPQR